MEKNLRAKIQALRLWMAYVPEKAMFHRGLSLSGQDADAIFVEVDQLRLAMTRQLSEFESLAQMAGRDGATILPFTPRGAP